MASTTLPPTPPSPCSVSSPAPFSHSALTSFAICFSVPSRRLLGLRLAAGGAHHSGGMDTSPDLSGMTAAAARDAILGEEEKNVTAGVAAAKRRKPGPLEKGGTLSGVRSQGNRRVSDTPAESSTAKFSDVRWRNGSWDLLQFTMNGKVDWDAVIDAEASRRKCLEESPVSTSSDDPVHFDSSMIPLWAWIRRFRMPETEVLNGQVAVVGFFIACIVDSLAERGFVDQLISLIGKLVLFNVVVGFILVRKKGDLQNWMYLVKEWNSYDKQWQTAYQDRPES
eukprot:c6827_g1_i1 orf=164-1006(+)